MDRRTFVKRSCMGGAGFILARNVRELAADGVVLPPSPPIDIHEASQIAPSPLRIPGLYPGRVIELRDTRSIVSNRVSQPVINQMLERGMKELTGESSSPAAWAKFVNPTDVVGIKINPSGAPACCSSPEIVKEIIRGLQSAGVTTDNIIVFDRYAYEIDIGSYQTHLPTGIRVIGIQENKLDASGYDPNVYCQASFFGEWETRSYLSSLVTQKLTKIINVPTMKDHSAAGVTGCLKNLGYGTFNNVARSHQTPYSFTDPLIGVMCSMEPLRSKAVLNIMDGTRMVWHGGPLTQAQEFIYPAGLLFVGTDPVATDTIELQAIEMKRLQEKAPSLWDRNPKSITSNSWDFYGDAAKNLFYRRPDHIAAAGKLGLGVSDLKQIDHRQIALG